MAQNPFFVKIPARGQVRVGGPDSAAFLQNLISNDIALLEKQPSLYACFLTPQGKFLHDFFITKDNGSYLLECEGGERAGDLVKRMSPFRLRTKVEISREPDADIHVSVGADGAGGYPDPRHPALGRRSREKPDGLEEKPFAAWDTHRIILGIPDGSRDMTVGADTLLECNIDKLNGISFGKGCYIGQEITARMQLRNLGKKHLYAVEADNIAPGTDIHLDGKLIGGMRSRCDGVGLAMLKDEAAPLLTAGPVRLLTAKAGAGAK